MAGVSGADQERGAVQPLSALPMAPVDRATRKGARRLRRITTYAVRPLPGAPVSAPCTWEEIESGRVGPQTFNLRGMRQRVDAVGELWHDLYENAGALPA